MYLLASGNSKIGRKTYSFSLPAKTTCRPTPWCQEHCYACKGLFHMRSVKELYERNLRMSKEIDFPERMIQEIYERKIGWVRIHVSGDFYSNEYLDAWSNIISNCPSTRFLAFSRRTDLPLDRLTQWDNITVRLSVDPSTEDHPDDILPLAIVEGSRFDHLADEVCSGGCIECGHRCWDDEHNVLLHVH